MKEPSDKRKRTLELQARALAFSTNVNVSCPGSFSGKPSERVWDQLVRAADSVSNNLVEADEASSDADFVNKIKLTLREAKESKMCLAKIRLARLDACRKTADLGLEQEALELSAIFAAIANNTIARLQREGKWKEPRSRRPGKSWN